MKIRREDARSLALIAGAGAVGLLGTLAVREIISAPLVPPPLPAPTAGIGEAFIPPIAQLRQVDLWRQVTVNGDRTFRIRSRSAGERSFPVIYVDDIRVRGSLQALMRDNKATIDRIEMIKGPAAKSLYGTEASAGVIRIFTRNAQDTEEEPEEQRRRRRRGRR